MRLIPQFPVRLVVYWMMTIMTSSLIITMFSCLFTEDVFQSYASDLSYKSTVYIRLTFSFYALIGLIVAFVGFLINVLLYLKLKFTNAKLYAIICNTIITSVMLYIYSQLGITIYRDFLQIIVPSYIGPVIMFGWLLLPHKEIL